MPVIDTTKLPMLVGADGYQTWKEAIQTYLRSQGVWKIVAGINTRPLPITTTPATATTAAGTESQTTPSAIATSTSTSTPATATAVAAEVIKKNERRQKE